MTTEMTRPSQRTRKARPPRHPPHIVSSEDLQGWGVVSVTVRLHHNLHILIERHQEAQKALNGKLPELTAQHLRYIGLADSEQLGGLDLSQAAIFHDPVDFEHKLRL